MSRVNSENGASYSKTDFSAGSGSQGPRANAATLTAAQQAAAQPPSISPNPMPPQNYFATWYFINLGALLIIGSLTVKSSSITRPSKIQLVVPAAVAFLASGIGTIIMTYDVWPRSGHARILGSATGFCLMLAYVIVTPGWGEGVEGDFARLACALSGFHLGFVLESVTGGAGRFLKLLEGAREEPEPPRSRAAWDRGAKPQPSVGAPSL
ncbi:hypothetical protein QIS74_00873 [Colletotrichum tabaci]|uniref:Uncharacterized protein n=1 Tax=Colletotrichum tabaci TaxID=1209068 RepID=A0AAV9TUH5_9PEZI